MFSAITHGSLKSENPLWLWSQRDEAIEEWLERYSFAGTNEGGRGKNPGLWQPVQAGEAGKRILIWSLEKGGGPALILILGRGDLWWTSYL